MEKHIFLRSGQLRRMQLSGDLWPHRGGEGGIPGESMPCCGLVGHGESVTQMGRWDSFGSLKLINTVIPQYKFNPLTHQCSNFWEWLVRLEL